MLWRPLSCSAFAFAILAVASAASADDTPTFADRTDDEIRDVDRFFGFMINPLAVVLGVFGGEADFVLGRHAAVAVEGGFYRRRDRTAAATGVGLLLYPFGSALRGAYVESRVVYAHPLTEGLSPLEWGADVVGLGATMGWQWTWDYGLSVRLGAGAMYFLGAPRQSAPNLFATGVQPVLDGSFGWAF